MMTNNWQTFFDHYAGQYMAEPFTRGTRKEVTFLIGEIGIPAVSEILDIGCGTGRHAIELARRGYRVTGLDLSKGMLAEARKKARSAAVTVDFLQADATSFRLKRKFDVALCLCEGAFGLLGMDEDPHDHDAAILRNIARVLKPHGLLVLNALNGLRMIREHSEHDIRKGRFVPEEVIEVNPMECKTPKGRKRVMGREKGYFISELRAILEECGFTVQHMWGGTAAHWGKRRVSLDEMEIMAVARRAVRGGSRP